jgi:nicotinamidase-related amidase
MLTNALIKEDDVVLVVVDIQERLLPAISGAGYIKAGCEKLIKGFAETKTPIIVTEQYPKGLGATDAQIKEACTEAEKTGSTVSYIEKTTFACTGEKSFLETLNTTRKNQVVLCGIETHVCVLQTAMELLGMGKEVFIASDAVSSRSEANRETGLLRMSNAGCIITNIESTLLELIRDSKHPSFKAISKLIK